MHQIRIKKARNSKIFLGEHTPDPPRERTSRAACCTTRAQIVIFVKSCGMRRRGCVFSLPAHYGRIVCYFSLFSKTLSVPKCCFSQNKLPRQCVCVSLRSCAWVRVVLRLRIRPYHFVFPSYGPVGYEKPLGYFVGGATYTSMGVGWQSHRARGGVAITQSQPQTN